MRPVFVFPILSGFGSFFEKTDFALCRPGGDLLSRVLRQSTIGAGAFHGRVRNGNGCSHPARTTRSAKGKVSAFFREAGRLSPFLF